MVNGQRFRRSETGSYRSDALSVWFSISLADLSQVVVAGTDELKHSPHLCRNLKAAQASG